MTRSVTTARGEFSCFGVPKIQEDSFQGGGHQSPTFLLGRKKKVLSPREKQLALLVLSVHQGLHALDAQPYLKPSDLTQNMRKVLRDLRMLMSVVDEHLHPINVLLSELEATSFFEPNHQRLQLFSREGFQKLQRWKEQGEELEEILNEINSLVQKKLNNSSLRTLIYSNKTLAKDGKFFGALSFSELFQEVEDFKVFYREESNRIQAFLKRLKSSLEDVNTSDVRSVEYPATRPEKMVSPQSFITTLRQRGGSPMLGKVIPYMDHCWKKSSQEEILSKITDKCQRLSHQGMRYIQKLAASSKKLTTRKKEHIEEFLQAFTQEMGRLRLEILDSQKVCESIEEATKLKDIQNNLQRSMAVLTTMDKLSPVLKASISLTPESETIPHSSTKV